ncbi:hypothetical protein AC792_14655 [Arthrobacter sp. RIT-PI-e]|uniref:hypothetical protein n=1 Tax=Arthrobacter sp. RIT-PI-e TaxID=1681197 RepID=UPI0006765AB9|nr:hypothetical protein [Arthrobacter sp. RIT-PI-e]KNC17311.1 hypothetical protein AC792_14655 [Arthrobacter sp. RIT-PI-e]
MNHEEQAPGPVERSAEPDLVDPDSVVLDEGVISAEALEPELFVSPDTLELPEPVLGAVEISRDTAEAASLDAAAAEAMAGAAGAERAGTLVGGPLPTDTPAGGAAPDGTSPAGGRAGDAADTTPDTTPGPGGAAAPLPDEAPAVPAPDPEVPPVKPVDHPSPEEVIADSATGASEDATPHPEPDEILAEGRRNDAAGPAGTS